MTKRRTAFYVTARVGHWTNYLLGPFTTARAAVRSIDVAQRCAMLRDDPRYRVAIYGFTRKRAPHPPGSLPLDENYVKITLDHRNNHR